MKTPRTEPYRRSPHRAALQAWVVAATAVASIGMPAAAATSRETTNEIAVDRDVLAPAELAERTASDWLHLLELGEIDRAMLSMRLPREAVYEKDVLDELTALSDWLAQTRPTLEPIASRHAGHWALSAWRLGEDTLIEPITLYHPATDGLAIGSGTDLGDWQIVSQGLEADPALAPLYNADYAELMNWYETLT